MTAAPECTCTWTDPKYWFTHYGATEPGSQMEFNPDCPLHRADNNPHTDVDPLYGDKP
jgi:hypothetical protein